MEFVFHKFHEFSGILSIFTCKMDANKVEPVIDATNIEASGWKSREHRNMTMKRM